MAKARVTSGMACMASGVACLNDCTSQVPLCCEPDNLGRVRTLYLPPGSDSYATVTGFIQWTGSRRVIATNETTTYTCSLLFNNLPLHLFGGGPITAQDCLAALNWTLASAPISSLAPYIDVSGGFSSPSGGPWFLSSSNLDTLAMGRAHATNYQPGTLVPPITPTTLYGTHNLGVQVTLGFANNQSSFRSATFGLDFEWLNNPCVASQAFAQSVSVTCEDIPNPGFSTATNPGGLYFFNPAPTGGSDQRVDGYDSGDWRIDGQTSGVITTGGSQFTQGCNFSLGIDFEYRPDPVNLPDSYASDWLVCPQFAEDVEQCTNQQPDSCCDQGDCGKINASFPFQWRRVASGWARLFDRNPSTLQAVVGYTATFQSVNDIQTMTGGECALSDTAFATSAGTGVIADQFGTNRILSVTGANVGGTNWPSNVRLLPQGGSGLGKKYLWRSAQPVVWTQTGGFQQQPMGVLILEGETLVNPGAQFTALTLTRAEFLWNAVNIGDSGIVFDASETRPVSVPLINTQEFDLIGYTVGAGCYRWVQLTPLTQSSTDLNRLLVETDRTGRIVGGGTTSQLRNVLIQINLSAYLEAINFGGCAQQALQQGNEGCVGCGGRAVNLDDVAGFSVEE